MVRKITTAILAFALLINICGCVVVLAGAAAGAGTAAWLSGKLTQEVNASFEKSITAVKSALKALKLSIDKETAEQNIAQIMSNYNDGRTIWIDIRHISQKVTQIDIRVGASGDKEAARKILQKITSYL
ncbi:MAG: DUF3568 family protein [Candidatus Omnitrophota bacterium]|nr:DUF3568 family protein [Candidatus Omnitrophota bacterium]